MGACYYLTPIYSCSKNFGVTMLVQVRPRRVTRATYTSTPGLTRNTTLVRTTQRRTRRTTKHCIRYRGRRLKRIFLGTQCSCLSKIPSRVQINFRPSRSQLPSSLILLPQPSPSTINLNHYQPPLAKPGGLPYSYQALQSAPSSSLPLRIVSR